MNTAGTVQIQCSLSRRSRYAAAAHSMMAARVWFDQPK